MGEVSEQLGARILFENERLRVWDDRVAPGETQHLHVHQRPYLAVVVSGDKAETVLEDGTVERSYDPITAGEAHWFGPEVLPFVHALRNTGSTEVSVVIVEFLDTAEGEGS